MLVPIRINARVRTHFRRGLWGLAILGGAALIPTAGFAEPDHTTYVIRTSAIDTSTVQAIEAAGGVIDHFDGNGTRAYILQEHWNAFLATGIVYTLESMQPIPEKQRSAYPSYAELTTYLTNVANANPTLCRLISIGQSVQGREIWALQITDQPGTDEDEPEFAYLSTMHGDETVGTVLCLNFIDYLLENFGQSDEITARINETEIWILPLLNPDGYEMGIRWNANNADLNRVFPEWPLHFRGNIASEGSPDTAGRQPEVAALMNWSVENSINLSANYHGGALVANYPYDEIPGIPSGVEAPTTEDALLASLASSYADRNPPMLASPTFPGGITNGSAWYSVSGGMGDWHYRYTGTIDMTLEVSNIKNPAGNTLNTFWDDNRDAMLDYLARVHQGIRGGVRDKKTNAALLASIYVDNNPQPTFSDADQGDYHRLLLPGTYSIRAEAPGYIPYTMTNLVVTENTQPRADLPLSTGDINDDNVVDALDLQLLVNVILGRSEDPAADVDGNGVSATDLQHLVNRILGRL